MDGGRDPLGALLAAQGFVVLDGGLATELERAGCDLDDPLWSAKVLLERPDAVREAHRGYLEAGADVVASATYQATFPGLRARGLSETGARDVFRLAVSLAIEERDAFVARSTRADASTTSGVGGVPPGARPRPLVAASLGPYGAYLADGGEYRGDYEIGRGDLYDFHAPRWETLAETEADLIACETTPSIEEAAVYCRLAAVSGRPSWISFQCRDATRIADGTPLVDAVALCAEEPNVVAVGVNCVDPSHVSSLIGEARRGGDAPVLVYPNSGETWDADAKRWVGSATSVDWGARSLEWARLGAAGVGGCCRVGPAAIAEIRAALEAGRGAARSRTGRPVSGRGSRSDPTG